MADERRMLDALDRLRVHGASAQLGGRHDMELMGYAASVETPPRRKSSALSLSHLTSATPIRSHTVNANTSNTAVNNAATSNANANANANTPTPSDAVRDIARELEAVEARLSVFRQRRQNPELPEEPVQAQLPEGPAQALVEDEAPTPTNKQPPSTMDSPKKPTPTQQAGEVADEVEHALANCDRLLHAASLTRSLRSSGRNVPSPGVSMVTTSSSRLPTSDELALEGTARAMHALVVSREDETKRALAELADQQRHAQTVQLHEIERKFASKQKLVLLAAREAHEAETRAVAKQTIADQERVQQDSLRQLESKMLAERERLLNEVLKRHQADTEDQLQRIQLKLQSETFAQKQLLEKQLQQEFNDTIRQIELDAEQELQRWQQKQRLTMESNVLARREQAATAVLRAQELKTNELKQQMQQQQTSKEAEELDKLQKALAFGAQAQLQQLRRQLDAEHDQRMSDTRSEAAHLLETKRFDLQQVLSLAHSQELDKTKRALEKAHRVAVMDMHEQLELDHRNLVDKLTAQAAAQLDAALSTLRVELDQQNRCKIERLQQTMERDHRVKLRQLEMEQDRLCDREIDRVRQQLTETQQRELEAKLLRLQQSSAKLLDEAVLFLAIKPEDRSAVGGGTTTTQALLHLKQLHAHLPKELQRAVSTLVADFEELTEEQQILVEKISDSTGLYLTFKRQCAQLEGEVNELGAAMQNLHAQLQTKDELAKKLYMANEALLKKLGLGEPT